MNDHVSEATFLAGLRAEAARLVDPGDPDSVLSQRRALTRVLGECLAEAGVIEEEPRLCEFAARGLEISGAVFAEQGETVDLFSSILTASDEAEVVPKADVEAVLRRMRSFLSRALVGNFAGLPHDHPVLDVALRIHDMRRDIVQVRLFAVTDGLINATHVADTEVEGVVVRHQLWDLHRFQRMAESGHAHEPITLDFVERTGFPLPCVMAPGSAEGEFATYVAVVPGTLLADLYEEYGSRLMELNVRSYLQARGKVNAQIRRTLREEPERFVAYNNGISATASTVEVDNSSGGCFLRSVVDIQIVNGGQTTASIFWARRRDRADLSKVRVQMKLTAVQPQDIDWFVPLISRYSNSQNKVSEVDFSGNDRFHVSLEKLSRSIWAPASPGAHTESRWFYERARGQYGVALGQAGTPAAERSFKERHPQSQVLKKEDVAKLQNLWNLRPDIVCLGGQKSFREFAIGMGDASKEDVDRQFFEDLVAKAIVWRTAERLITPFRFGGYRAHVTAYTVAYVLDRTDGKLDLGSIWRRQEIGPGTARAIEQIAPVVKDFLVGSAEGRNVTEWAKKDACWTAVRKLAIRLPEALDDDLQQQVRGRTRDVTYSGAEAGHIRSVRIIPAEQWFNLASWYEEREGSTSSNGPALRRLARTIGAGNAPTPRLAEIGVEALQNAVAAGFSMGQPAAPPAATISPVGDSPTSPPATGCAADILRALASEVNGHVRGTDAHAAAAARQERYIALLDHYSEAEAVEKWQESESGTAPGVGGYPMSDSPGEVETSASVAAHEPAASVAELLADAQPAVARHLLRLYATARGGTVTSGTADEVLTALAEGAATGTWDLENELGTSDWRDCTVRLSGAERVRVRPAGDRSWSEIPPSELWATLREFAVAEPSASTTHLANRLAHRLQITDKAGLADHLWTISRRFGESKQMAAVRTRRSVAREHPPRSSRPSTTLRVVDGMVVRDTFTDYST